MKKTLKKFISLIAVATVISLGLPTVTLAAGIYPSGGGQHAVGQNFSISVRASGAEFDALQGVISISGPVSVVGFAAGGATWLPGKAPTNGGQFVGIVSPTNSATVATVTLRGTNIGSGSLSVSGVALARNGSYVGSSGGSVTFSIVRAPTPPGTITVTSTTHPDQNTPYEATTVELAWQPPTNGAQGYSYTFDDKADTVPEAKITGTALSAKYDAVAVGIHYFHIRSQNSDGWGGTTHFKVTIKEPDAKVDDTLAAPSINSVEKAKDASNDIEKGTLSGIMVKGSGAVQGFTIILSIDPKDRVPASLFAPIPTSTPDVTATDTATPIPSPETSATPTATPIIATPLMATPQSNGDWEIQIKEPILAGFYKLTAQGQKEKTLTPKSSEIKIEVSIAKGGSVRIISASDQSELKNNAVNILGVVFKNKTWAYTTLGFVILLILLLAAGIGWHFYKIKRNKKKLTNQIS